MFEVIAISFAYFLGLAVRQAGLPPLVGFLAAGFGLNYFGPAIGLPGHAGEILGHVAHLGVLMLLFTVGLKLKLGQIAQPQVLGGGLAHFAITVGLVAPGVRLIGGTDWNTALLLAIALAFSSTVLAAKLLEGKRELGAFHGRTAIGILIVQDILALAVLAIWNGQTPAIWALGLLGLPVLRPVLYWLLDFTGHDELLVLMGMLLAVVLGGTGFEALGLSSELGALVMGVMLSRHRRAKELSEALWSLKEVLLVGFFLQIGMSGLPDLEALYIALAFAVLLPLKGVLFFFILAMFGLRARSSFLAALSLTAYSEFGLIVSASVLPEFLVPLALCVAVSFIIAAPLNRYAHPLYARYCTQLERFEVGRIHPDEHPVDLGDAEIVIFGMGRTGTAAYDYLAPSCDKLIGLEMDAYRVANRRDEGRNVVLADAENVNLWRSVRLDNVRAVILAMDDIESKTIAAQALRRRGFEGPIVTHALYDEHLDQLSKAGATHTYLTMYQAGMGLAEHASRAMRGETEPTVPQSTSQG
ncbi:sodium:proton exchanger [Rhodobacteraceae bacterium WD3A24]|nr:sodium:proton exchanger [Rhodobacteraceae bacterium WD3A24]